MNQESSICQSSDSKHSLLFIQFLLGGVVIALCLRGEAKYKLVSPAYPKPGAALFVVLHGCLSNGEDIEEDTRFSEYVNSNNIYVMYPEPYGPDAWHGCWDFFGSESQRVGGGDAAKLVKDIQSVAETNKISSRKIFAAGMSAGASLLNVVTACYPDVLSGVVIHSGIAYGLADTWQNSLKIAKDGPSVSKTRNLSCNPQNYRGQTILVQGTNDHIMNPSHYDLLKKDYFTGAQVIRQNFSGDEDYFDYQIEFFSSGNQLRGLGILVKGMRHDWSGGVPRIPFDKYGPDITPFIIQHFLKKSNAKRI